MSSTQLGSTVNNFCISLWNVSSQFFLQSLKDDAEVTPWKQRWRTLEAFWITVLALMHHLLEVTNNLLCREINM